MQTNFQSLATRTGADFHNTCVLTLEKAGWDIADTHVQVKDVGIELDAIANNRQGIAFPFEFKGGYGDRPGMERTDNVLKAIGSAYLFSLSEMYGMMTPLLVLTTFKPEKNASFAMLRRVSREIILDVLVVPADSKQLKRYAEMDEAEIKRLLLVDEERKEINRRRGGWYDCFNQAQLPILPSVKRP